MTSRKDKKFSARNRLLSFRYAFLGVRTVFRDQHNIRIEAVMAALAVTAGFIFSLSATEWILLLLVIALVLSLEMVNTALEYLVDLASPGRHPVAGKIKDIAAGAVLISAIFSVIIGLILFIPKILNL